MNAYIVSTYHLPEQAVRLVRLLATDPDDVVLVHHDANAPDDTWRVLRDELESIDNVVLLPREACGYATFDHVQVTLRGIGWIARNRPDVGHVVLLTGQCYPIKPLGTITQWLGARDGQSIIEVKPLPHPTWPDQGYNRVDVWMTHVRAERLPNLVRRALPKRQGWAAIPKPALLRHRLGGRLAVHLPKDVPALYGGLGYWALAGEHALHIHAHREPFVRFFRRAYIPDELFFQTALMASPFRDAIVDDRIHLVDFRRQGGITPYTWTRADMATISASDKLFARKFDVRVDADVLDDIDRELLASGDG